MRYFFIIATLAVLLPSTSLAQKSKTDYSDVEVNAQFDGGDINHFEEWIAQQIVYPPKARKKHIQGKVLTRILINQEGYLVRITIMKSSGNKLLDKEAIRVLKLSPQWTPAKQSGRNVNQLFTVPIIFKIE